MSIDSPTDGARKRRLTITTATAEDRDRVFRRARRHTLLVRALRALLPSAALVAAGAYALAVLSTAGGPVDTTPSLATTRIVPENLTMDNPVYDNFATDGSHYVVRAKTAVTNITQTGPIRLNVITGEVKQPNNVVTKLSANWGLFDRTKGVLDLFERVDVDGSNGMKARLTQAHIYPKDNRIVSNERSHVEMPTATVKGDKLEMNSKARTATFTGAVEVRLKPTPKTDKTGDTAIAVKPSDGKATDMLMRSDAPIDVVSEQLDINDITKVAIFKHNVRATQGEAGLTASELEVRYTGKAEVPTTPDAITAPKAAADGLPGADSARLSMLLARGGVVMTKADSRAESDEAVFDATAETGILLGSLVMTSGTDRKVTGDRADLDQRKDTALVTGAEVVTIQGQNILRGRRLFVDRKAGTSRLDSPAGPGVAAGRISAHLVQKEKDAASAAKTDAKAPAVPAFMTGSFKSDPNAPMDVDADVLNVDDRRKTAIFTGNVIAKQGAFEVRSSELVATYTGEAGLMNATPATAPIGSPPPKAQSQLTKVETRQKVLITGNDGQTVTGNWAVFDVKSNMATVGGDVVVGQGKNVVRGPLLKINLTTGHYNFIQEPAANPWAVKKDGASGAMISSAPSGSDTVKAARPSMLLYPKELKEAQQQKKANEAAAAGAPKGDTAPAKRSRVPSTTDAPGWAAVPAAPAAPPPATEAGN